MVIHDPTHEALAKARALLDAVTFDSDGVMVGVARQGGNGGLLSQKTLMAADHLRQALERLDRPPLYDETDVLVAPIGVSRED